MSEYKWKKGAADFAKHDAQAIGDELEQLRVDNGGQLQPPLVVEAARNKGSAMHDLFPWNDRDAARIARELIAQRLVRSIHVTIVRDHKEPIDTRAFVSTKVKDEPRHYTSIEAALEDEEGRAYLVRQAWLQLKAWRRKYSDLTELAMIHDAIDQELARKAS